MHPLNLVLATACSALAIGAVGLSLPQPVQAQPPEREDVAPRGRSGEHRVDPCDSVTNSPGETRGRDNQCRSGGSSSGIARGDFNGDGFADMAVGVPYENTPAHVSDSGAVVVIYGSANGLTSTGGAGIPPGQFWSQNSPGVQGTSEANDLFGSALAAGDFNDDGFSDLAIGVPGERIVSQGVGFCGMVVTIFGSANGLTTDPNAGVPGSQSFSLEQLNRTGSRVLLFSASRESDIGSCRGLGSSLAWGDYNGDGVGDLAAATPNILVDAGFPTGPVPAGAVGVLHGRAGADGGLTAVGSQLWTQESPGIEDQAERDDGFGTALAAGDFDGDGETDLAIGVPGETDSCGLFQSHLTGAVQVLYGQQRTGLTDTNDEFLLLDFFLSRTGGSPCASLDVGIGTTLAAGDFNGDARADLAIGVPFANRSGATHGGVIFAHSGTAQGLRDGSTQQFDQNALFGAGNESEDHFGAALAAGDFDGDGRADLAVGAPGEDVGSIVDAGAVFAVYGSAEGLSATGRAPQSWHQNVAGLGSSAETGDHFGASLTAWNFGRNETRRVCSTPPICLNLPAPTADLAIGVPDEDVGTIRNAGAVNVIYGTINGGLASANSQVWTQTDTGAGASNTDDHFGLALY